MQATIKGVASVLSLAAALLAALLAGWPIEAPVASADAQAMPDQVHVSWVGDPSTSMAVTWRTASDSAGPYLVQWGQAPGHYSAGQVAATSESAPGGRGFLHKAEITGLEADSAYHYRVSGDSGAWGADLSFHTAPASMPPGGVVFTVNGDVGTSYVFWDVEPVMSRLAQEDAGLHLIAGDLTYGDLHRGTEEEEHWFANDLAIVAARRPVMVTWGNHEYEAVGDVDIGTITRYFQLPRTGRANACNPFPYYAFRYADIHFVMLDDPSAGNLCFDRSVQQSWLRESLAGAAGDPTVKWKVVVVHRPPFSSGCHGSEALNRYPEFDQYRVDLVLAAHDHNYERTWPVSWDGGRVVTDYNAPGYPMYVVAGVGGATTYDCVSSNPWTVFHDPGQYVGYLRVTATDARLLGEFVAKEAYRETADFSVVDRFELTR